MTVSIEEAQARLPQLLAQLTPGQELVITQGDVPIARILPEPKLPTVQRVPGSAKGQLLVLQDDEEHLQDFGEYQP